MAACSCRQLGGVCPRCSPAPAVTEPEKPLQILPSRVLAAAKTCPDVERAMKNLFPEVFVKPLGPLEIKKDTSLRHYYVVKDAVQYRIKRAEGFRGLLLPSVPGHFWAVNNGELQCLPREMVATK